MCQTQTKAQPARYVRWMCDDPASMLRCGHRAPLVIVAGKDVTGYWIERVDGGWRMWKEQEDGADPIPYDIDTTFGPDPAAHWTCDCADYTFRSHRRQVRGCKHVLALAAALRRIGLLEAR